MSAVIKTHHWQMVSILGERCYRVISTGYPTTDDQAKALCVVELFDNGSLEAALAVEMCPNDATLQEYVQKYREMRGKA